MERPRSGSGIRIGYLSRKTLAPGERPSESVPSAAGIHRSESHLRTGILHRHGGNAEEKLDYLRVIYDDIDAFILALQWASAYEQQYPDCDVALADINGDGHIDGFDIDPFVDLMGGG